jgi:glycosyltransferase involved in cell wall biosynthesis
MKIIYLHQYFKTPSMSGGVRSYDIAKYLVDNGHTVNMVTTTTLSSSKRGWRYSNEGGINVYWLTLFYSNKLSYFKRLVSFFSFACQSAKKGSELDGDIIYATSTPLTIAIPALYISWKRSIPIVFEVRDLWPEIPISMGILKNPVIKYAAIFLEKYIYEKSTAVIALSDGMRNGIIKAGCDKDKVFVIPNFSNSILFSKHYDGREFHNSRPWFKGDPLMVYTGTFGLVNGVSYLVDIAEQLALIDSKVKVLLVGDGVEYEHVLRRAEVKGVLNKNFFIEKPVSKLELSEILAAATLATNIVIEVPELWNNSANKFFDALASGTPVVVNCGGWQADLLETQGAGFTTFNLSFYDAAVKINNFILDKHSLLIASNNAKMISKKYFDKNNLVKKIEKVLNFSCDQD